MALTGYARVKALSGQQTGEEPDEQGKLKGYARVKALTKQPEQTSAPQTPAKTPAQAPTVQPAAAQDTGKQSAVASIKSAVQSRTQALRLDPAQAEQDLLGYSARLRELEQQPMGVSEGAVEYLEGAKTRYEAIGRALEDMLPQAQADPAQYAERYNALLRQYEEAGRNYTTSAQRYNRQVGAAQQTIDAYNETLRRYRETQAALDNYTRLHKNEPAKLEAQAKVLDLRADDTRSTVEGYEELHPDYSRMTPDQVGQYMQENVWSPLQQAGEMKTRAEQLREQAAVAQSRVEDMEYRDNMRSYLPLMQAEDWSTKSQADAGKMQSTGPKYGVKTDPITGTTSQILVSTGYDDIDYAIINGDTDALNEWNGYNGDALDKSYLTQMTDEERGVYNYLYATRGKKAAQEFLEQVTPRLQREQRRADEAWWRAETAQHPWATSLFSVLVSPAKAISLWGQAASLVADGKIDPNASYNKFSYIPTAIRGEAAKQAEKWGESGSFLYQTGMSMLDFIYQAALTGSLVGGVWEPSGGALAQRLGRLAEPALQIMGTGAAADTVISLLDQGMDSTRAFILGVAAGFAEILTETVSLEALLNPDELADGVIKYIMKNMLAEGSEEAASDVLNWSADALYDLISGQSESEWKRSVRELETGGMSRVDAVNHLLTQRITELGLDALGGALSGGLMAVGGAAINRTGPVMRRAGAAAGDILSAAKEAQQMTATINDTPLAGQATAQQSPVQENILETAQAEPEAQLPQPLQAALDKLTAGEDLSLNDARRVMASEEAMQTLRDAGVLTEEARNDSAGRKAVADAIRQYAEQATEAEQANLLETAEQTAAAPAQQNLLATGLTAEQTEGNLEANETQEVSNGQETAAPERGAEARAGEQSAGGDQRRAPDLGTRGGRFIQNFRASLARRQQLRRAVGLRYSVRASGAEALSTKDAGFANGTDTKTFAILPDSQVTRDMRRAESVLAKEGVKVHWIQGYLELQGKNGVENARGLITPDGKDIWVRADNTVLSWQQLLDHELMHRKLRQDPGLRDRILNQLRGDREVAPYFEEVVRQYVKWYGEYDVTNKDAIIDELLCDYAGGFNDVQAAGAMENPERGTKYDVSGIKRVQKLIQSEAKARSIAEALDTGRLNDAERYSYESLANAAGFDAIPDGDGGIRGFARNGQRVTEVTEEDVRKSPIGALISFAAEEGYLGGTPEENKSAADAQVKFFSDLCTLAASNRDFGMSMNFAGAVAFTAVKSNADHQYGTTVDFKSICVKTQAIIDAMSAAMVEKKGALTKAETLAIYRRTALNGLPVPCPECYVFSRWIGIGGLLDNIWQYQSHYGKMTPQQVVDAREDIYHVIEDKMQELNASLPADKQLTFGKARGKLKDTITKQYNKLREKVELADNTGAAVSAADREKLAGLESMMTDVKALSWIDGVYFGGKTANVNNVNPNYSVPAEILFDLNKGGEFATQHPEAWAFRTTQGAGYGKAITPYADARLGEAILGAANITATTKGRLQGTLDNPFLRLRGEVDDDARKKLRQAVAKQKAQLFRGGQRFSSTSDMSNDVASDLLIAMLDMQTMNAGVQMYTKVDGAVGGLAGMGAYVNQSLMPLGSGIKNGELADTAVGGMNPGVAFANRERYETAGTITIGVNDRHIRMLFNALNRDFVIPYHASGGDQQLVGEMRAINDPDEAKGAKVRSSDYTKTQNDKVMSDALLRELGKTEEEIEQVHRSRAARLAILTRTKYAPDMEVIRADPILSELYDRFNGGRWDGVKLTKDDVESFIYPNEFWDETVDYEHSSRNTKLYLDYCDTLGFLHRFSGVTPQAVKLPGGGTTTRLRPVKGYDENGSEVMLTDLAYRYDENGNRTDEIEPFFWKALVDRRMYGNDGQYLPPRTIRLTGLTTEDITEFAKNNVGRQYNAQASADLADQVRNIVNQNKGDTEAMVKALRELLGNNGEQSLSRERSDEQDEVGSTLKTAKGSPIKRNGKYGVGKEIGGRIYLHKQYAGDVIPAEEYERAQQIVAEEYPDFTYNCVEYEPKTGTIRFDEAPGFDTEREPAVGDYVEVKADGSTRKGHTDYIWHHKWLWVKNDYQGFDVAKSWNWSKQWLSTITGKTYEVNGKQYNDNGKADGNGIGRWNAQLDAYGLERDGAENTLSRERSDGIVRQGHTSAGTSINFKKVPVLYTTVAQKVGWKPGSVNVDIGAGDPRTPQTAYLEEQQVTNMPFDPFNRPKKVNMETLDYLRNGNRADTVTCSNCLNVIDSAEARSNVILECAKALKPDGTAYFTMYAAPTQGESKAKPDQWQEARKAETYKPEIEQWFDNVEVKYGMVIATNPKENLPEALWQVEAAGSPAGGQEDVGIAYSRESIEKTAESNYNHLLEVMNDDDTLRDYQRNLSRAEAADLKRIFGERRVSKQGDRDTYCAAVRKAGDFKRVQFYEGRERLNADVINEGAYTREMLEVASRNKACGLGTRFVLDDIVYDDGESRGVMGLADWDKAIAYVKVNPKNRDDLRVTNNGSTKQYGVYLGANTVTSTSRHERLHLVYNDPTHPAYAAAMALYDYIENRRGPFVKTFDQVNYWYQRKLNQGGQYDFSSYTEETACDLYAGQLRMDDRRIWNAVRPMITAIDNAIGGNASYSREFAPENLIPYTGPQRSTGRGRSTNPRKKVSRVRTNAFELGGLYNEVERQMAETQPEEFTYDPISEKRSMSEALDRLRADFDGEAERLSGPDQWGGSDLDTAMGILHRYRQIGRETGDYSRFHEWSHIIQQKGTKGGQFVQAFAKYSRTATEAARRASEQMREAAGKLTPAQQQRVRQITEGIIGAMDTAEAARGAVQDATGTGGMQIPPTNPRDAQRARDGENVIHQIYQIFREQRDHGIPVADWTKETGDRLASRIAARMEPKATRAQTTMQTILDDLVNFAAEHALPRGENPAPRTAIERITDYLNNKEAYARAWQEAKEMLRAQYVDDPDKLEALESFLTATISYNGEDTDRTTYKAILESADLLGMTKQDILNLAAAGVGESAVRRIADEFVRRVGTDETALRDAVERHIGNLIRENNIEGRTVRMEDEAAREMDIRLRDLLRESGLTKAEAASRIAWRLVSDLGITDADAAIAADYLADHYMRRLQAQADRELQRMLQARGERIKPAQRDKLMDLIHLGGLTNANVEDAVVDALGLGKLSRAQQRQITETMARFAETLDFIADDDVEGLRQLIREQAAVRNTKLDWLAEKVLDGTTDVEYLRSLAMAQLDLIAGDYVPRTAGEKISTFQTISHLLNAKTAMRNLTSNQVFDLVESAANNVGLLPDLIMSRFTGQRGVGLQKSWASQAKRRGAIEGAGRNLLEIALDAAPEERNRSKYGTGGRRTWSMANSGTVGRILSQLERVLGYELNTTDEFHKGSVYAETLESLARFVDAGQMTEEEAVEFARQEALYRSFQDDTLVGNILGGLRDLGNLVGIGSSSGRQIRGRQVHDFGAGDLIAKYTQVPGALIHRAIEFSPVGYIKAAANIAQLANLKHKGESTLAKQRSAALAIGRATTGSGLIVLFTLLAKLGLLKRKESEDDANAAALLQSQGVSGTQLNVTALTRMLSGGSPEPQKGDVLTDIGFLEPLDSLMTIATLLANDPELKGLDLYQYFSSGNRALKTTEKSLEGIWLALENTSAMQTLSNIYSAIRYHDAANDLPLYQQIPFEIASSAVTGFVPSPVRQLAQATDTVYRDQYRSQNLLDQTAARVANTIPGVRNLLDPKLTPLGEPRKYQSPFLNALNTTINPGGISVYDTDAVRDELFRVYDETGDHKVMPERNAPYSVTISRHKYTLTPNERTEYQRTRGQLTGDMIDAVLGKRWYKDLSDVDKADLLNWIGNFANYVAKVELAGERGDTYVSTTYKKYYEALQSGTKLADIAKMYAD